MASFLLFYWVKCAKRTIPGLAAYNIQDDSAPSITKLFKYIFPVDRWPKYSISVRLRKISQLTLERLSWYLFVALRANGARMYIIVNIGPLKWTQWPPFRSLLDLPEHKMYNNNYPLVATESLRSWNCILTMQVTIKSSLRRLSSQWQNPSSATGAKTRCQYSIWTSVICPIFRNLQ